MAAIRVHPQGIAGSRAAGQVRFPMPAIMVGRSTRPAWSPLGAPNPPLRCRLGRHRWLPLDLSLRSARCGLTMRFCRHCPAAEYVR